MAVNIVNKFNQREIEILLKTEYKFINNLFSIVSIPTNTQNDESSDEETSSKKPQLITKKTTRATSLVDLQSRIQKLKSKNNATYKDKIQKKNLKNRLKKKVKQEKRNAVQKQIRANKADIETSKAKSEDNPNETKPKPVFNKDSKMVFSKIDFNGLGKEKHKKARSNPKKMLEQVQQAKTKVEKLKETGESEKAVEIQEKTAWKNALAKSQGVKVKDDPILLKKSIKKIEQKKRSSKKKWDTRIEGVKKAREEKQKKRTDNIQKRKKDKKLHKMKRDAKKGKVIPGF